jgi:steroid 5-alpha reductase family enzyme
MKRKYVDIIFAYLIAGSLAVLVGSLARNWDPLLMVAAADLAGTVVIFGFSVFYDNSSVYDAYWSVAPVLIVTYWFLSSTPNLEIRIHQAAVMVLVFIWGVRLTLNWAVRWQGITHEDWRYRYFRKKHGSAYWVVSFFGIHLMPTILVFLGCIPLRLSFESNTAFNALNLIAILVTAGAIWIEARADLDITRFTLAIKDDEELLMTGLWSLSRHPNYFGEIAFWWGLFLFAFAANPDYWWAIIGPISITLLFVFISIPMIEKRMLDRKPEYANYIKTTSVLIPWWKRERKP